MVRTYHISTLLMSPFKSVTVSSTSIPPTGDDFPFGNQFHHITGISTPVAFEAASGTMPVGDLEAFEKRFGGFSPFGQLSGPYGPHEVEMGGG